jgi:rubrerythrin
MAELFRGHEFIEIALAIEENGLAFYTSIASKAVTPEAKKLFQFLADQEREHARIFQNLLSVVSVEVPAEGYAGEYESYMRSLADGHVFVAREDSLAQQTRSLHKAIEVGMRAEKDSILFYSEMKSHIPPEDYPVLDTIITEEKKHLQLLSTMRAETSAADESWGQ